MRYLSVCSGIEAATVAWHPLGWEAVAFAEVDAFPSAVLAHHYPHVPNLGDMTKFREWTDADVDVLVGGTPCQSFSVAGLRKGLADPRGNLALVFLALADRYRPEWIVWENVPGVLSLDGGRDFGAFLGGLVELGYGFAYRVLDAQFFGVAQRRRRVFVVGRAGDWRGPAAVLLERAGLCWDSPPSRQAGQGVAGAIDARAGRGFNGQDATNDKLIPQAFGGNRQSGPLDVATAVSAHGGPHGRLDFESETFIAHSLRGEGFDASEDGTGRGTPIIPIDMRQASRGATMTNNRAEGSSGGAPGTGIGEPGDPAPTVSTSHPPAVAFQTSQSGVRADDVHATLDSNNGSRRHNGALIGSAVRRLTPRECERLQGFPDDYTLIPYRNGVALDGPRYKALGNSMAVPVMAWIGSRIEAVAAILQAEGRAA